MLTTRSGRCVPPSTAEGHVEGDCVLEPLGDRLDVPDLRLQILLVGDEHLQVRRDPRLVVRLNETYGVFRAVDSSGLRSTRMKEIV